MYLREDMTTEEKAKAYAEKVFCDAAKVCSDKPWNEFRDTYKQAYLAGATEALASQWEDPKVELPETDADVVAIDANGLHIAAYFNGEWYSSDDEFSRNPQMWLPIPPLKGGDA